MSKNLPITEWQTGVAKPDEWPLQKGDYRGKPSSYKFLSKISPNHYAFQNEDGNVELFYRRQSCCGWHLKRGRMAFEFVRSLAD